MIAGEGIPLDAVRVDFAAGAVERMVLQAGDEYTMLFIEGQGSLLHPGSTATLPLMRGSQPTDMILVHRAGQQHIRDLPEIRLPPLQEVINVYETLARVATAGAGAKVRGIALNTHHLEEERAVEAIAEVQSLTGLPCTDVVRFGAAELLEAFLL
jgi:uncharacterized NAD-dependent epimerase/dehydratase family protein